MPPPEGLVMFLVIFIKLPVDLSCRSVTYATSQ
ncbi:hypothetical protein [Salmonella phage Tennessee]|uniref:Uncharacterized protein n=2 Tax=unclassified Caudoviricetes TaxID=2788787 RepID=A0AB39C385_9CAUD|nr:hypothetical protein vBSenS3_24 [Salmonella phage vB_SenS-3]